MSKLSAKVKLLAVREVLENKKSLKEIASKYDCSRQILYSWAKKYRQNPEKGLKSLENRYKKGKNHPKKLGWQVEKRILDVVIKDPHLSVFKIRDLLRDDGVKISSHGVHNVLTRYNLQTKELRERFSVYHPVKTVFAHKLAPAHRAKVVEEFLEGKAPIAKVCTKWKVSRPTFYAWLNAYKEAIANEAQVVEALIRKYKKGNEHHRASSYQVEEAVLELIRANPTLSVHSLAQNLKGLIGHHGIQNILARNEINTYEARVRWVQDQYIPEPIPVPVEAPALPRSRLLRLIAHFRTIPKLVWNNPITWPFALPPLLFVAYIFELDQAFRPTVLFPIIALSFGFVFFLYSFKYYASLILVLWLGSKQEKDHDTRSLNSDPGSGQNKSNPVHILQFQLRRVYKNTVERYVRKVYEGKGVGLSEDLSRVTLSRFPFVSVHLPIYNEKRVVERVMKACSAFEWSRGAQPNYEVIVIDDSTDETTEIALKALADDGWKVVKTTDWGLATSAKSSNDTVSSKPDTVSGSSSNSDPGSEKRELELFYATKAGNPQIKYIHRFSRAGFKGGALAEALRICDAKAEYILVFDADFVPYPDTIEQFVKYFQLSAGNMRMDANGKERINANERMAGSNIAAVQGYQWHVLNKSENWITRGVRSEYAGSYVVERSAIELYGGLKMIAGSVYAIRADVLRAFGWGTSITEDFELTLKLYEAGYKVVYTPYIQAPAEAVSTIRRMIRQRMRWAEGHSFNIRHHLKAILNSRQLTRGEKFEFAFLGPYYLQAAFFVIGTLAWFLSETVLHVSLPYWSAALGWSLVFTNFLALPLINLLGLFLEQSEEKDYLGVASFILLSYIVTPFQAYAAVKGFLEKEEGPWFRTPKSGKVTDVIGRVRIGHWTLKLPFGRPSAVNNVSSILNNVSAAPVLAQNSTYNIHNSSYNLLHGYSFKPRRISLVSRSVIASLLIVVMTINYLAFFAEPKPVEAVGTPEIEQQINIIDQEYNHNTTTYNPVDTSDGVNNGLGLIRWDADAYTNVSTVKFEAVIKISNSAQTASAALFTSSGTQVTGSQVDQTGSTTYARKRSGAITLTDNTDYTVRIKSSAGATATIQAARLIIYQLGSNGGSITKSETQVEMGGNDAFTATSYAVITSYKEYCYSGSIPAEESSACTSASGVFSPTPTIYFEATLRSTGSDVGNYNSMRCPAADNCKIAHYDGSGTKADLIFTDCGNATCSSGNTDTTVDSTGIVGAYASMYCVSSTDCKISYYDQTNGDLKFVDCGDETCSSVGRTITTVDGCSTCSQNQNVGQYTSIYCPATDNCKVVYYDVTDGDLIFLDCGDAECDAGNTVTTIDGCSTCSQNQNVGQYTKIYCVSSTDCKVTYYDVTDGDLIFLDCGANETCSSGNTVTTVDGCSTCNQNQDVGKYTTMDCLSDGADCQVAYQDETDDDLWYLNCGNATCSASNNFQLLDGNTGCVLTGGSACSTSTITGLYNSIDCVTVTDCKIAYYTSGTSADLNFADCNVTTNNCDSGNQTDVDGILYNCALAGCIHTTLMGPYASMDCLADALDCKIAYQHDGNNDLRFADCGSATCDSGNAATATFGATGTVYAQLTDIASGAVSGSEVSTSSNSYTRVRSSAITLTSGGEIRTEVKVDANIRGEILNGKIVLQQAADQGISNLETMQMYANRNVSTNSATATRFNFDNLYDAAQFSGTITTGYEVLLQVSGATNNANAISKGCQTDETDCSTEVSNNAANNGAARNRITWTPASGVESDSYLRCTSDNTCVTDGKTGEIETAAMMVIQSSAIPTPEIAILTLPGMILLPKLIRWFQERRKGRRKKAGGNGKPPLAVLGI